VTIASKSVIILTLQGDLIGEQSGIGLLDLLNDHINDGKKNLGIDLSEVRYMNSSGIGVLITILTKFRNAGGDIVLINPSEQIRKLLVITKLNSIFKVFSTVEEAERFFIN
jgi:anti-sigma B factor antagonist